MKETAAGLPRRDDQPHTYANYLTWPEDTRYELINLRACRSREYWLVHPTGYRLEHGRYGVPEIRELQGRQSVGVLPEAEIDWELFAGLLGP